MGRARTWGTAVVLAAVVVTACTPDDESAGPKRYLPVDSEPCAVALGDLVLDPLLVGVEEVAEIEVPDGAVRLWRGRPLGDRDADPDDLMVGDVRVSLQEFDDQVVASWFESDDLATEIRTGALSLQDVEDMLPDLIAADGLAGGTDVVVDAVPGATEAYVGPPPTYDTAVGSAAGLVFGSGEPVSHEGAAAFFGELPESELSEGVWTFTLGAPRSATAATVIDEAMEGGGVSVEEVGAAEFVDVLDELAERPMRLSQGAPLPDAAFRCEPVDESRFGEIAGPADVAGVSAREAADGSWSVDIELVADSERPGIDELYAWLVLDFGPAVRFVTELSVATSPEPRTIDSVTFDDLTEQEAEFLVDRLTEGSAAEGS